MALSKSRCFQSLSSFYEVRRGHRASLLKLTEASLDDGGRAPPPSPVMPCDCFPFIRSFEPVKSPASKTGLRKLWEVRERRVGENKG